MTPRLEEAFKDFLLYFQDGKGTRMKDVNKEFLAQAENPVHEF